MPITIHPELEAKLRAQAQAAGISVESYIERNVQGDPAGEEEIEALAIEGLNSGESMEADDRYWAEKRRRLVDRRRTVNTRYVVKPEADRDFNDYADYLSIEADLDVANRFSDAVYSSFALLAAQPSMGRPSLVKYPGLEALRVFRVAGFEYVLILYRPLDDGVEILRVVFAARSQSPLRGGRLP